MYYYFWKSTKYWNDQRCYSLSVKDNTTFDSTFYQLESTVSLPSYYNEVKQLTSDASSIESNEDNEEYCASAQKINSCINTDSNHIEIIPVTSRFPYTCLVNNAEYIADSNCTSNYDHFTSLMFTTVLKLSLRSVL